MTYDDGQARPTFGVDARHSKGVVVGENNEVHNTFISQHRGHLVVAVAALLLAGIVTGGAALILHSSSAESGGAKAAGAAVTAPAAPDPFLYVATGNMLHLDRQQTCDGLFGLCLGQPISFALQAFGPSEADGYPQSDGTPGGECHGWKPKQLDLVTICGTHHAIQDIRVDSSSASPVAVAAPDGNKITLSDVTRDGAAAVTGRLSTEPYSSTYAPSEGESIFSFSWYLSAPPDGPADTVMTIIGRTTKSVNQPQRPCPGVSDVYYHYRDLLPLTALAATTSVEVSTTEYAHSGESPPPCNS